MTAKQQLVLAHIGGALLMAQLIERFLGLLLRPSPGQDAGTYVERFDSALRPERQQALGRLLAILRSGGPMAPGLESMLDRFLTERNKLAHHLPDLGSWDLQTDHGQEQCLDFLRGFIDRGASIHHLFASALSAKQHHYGPQLSEQESAKFTSDMQRVYQLVSIRWVSAAGA
jgi:hypothetical protein